MMIQFLTILYLAAQSILDLRERRISLLLSAVYSSVVLVTGGLELSAIYERIPAFLAGVFLLAAGAAAKNAIGAGDAIVVFTLGFGFSLSGILFILLAAFTICGALSMILLLSGKKHKEDSLPFIPFLLAGELVFLGFQHRAGALF